MKILAIDTSSRSGSVALLESERSLHTLACEGDEPYSSQLFKRTQDLLNQASTTLAQIELFAVAGGPGTFTGLRVGLTAAKAWAELYSRPIVAISTLEAVAIQGPESASILAPILDAHRGEIFGAVYMRAAGALQVVGEDMVLTTEEYFRWFSAQAFPSAPIFLSPDAALLEDVLAACPNKNCTSLNVSPMLAPHIGKLALSRAQRGMLSDALHLDANYVRRSDAELLWKGF
jgi:tRNA threonylcarbamoyladenosine biosynthesis protein TsaB